MESKAAAFRNGSWQIGSVTVATARAAADMFESLFEGERVEKLAIAHLDDGGRVIGVRERPGSLEDEVALPVRELLTDALRAGATSILLAHNHPSGDAHPSRADVEATRSLAAAAEMVGIRLHDHLIFGAGECRSLRGLGLL